jgi:hypothetical protein
VQGVGTDGSAATAAANETNDPTVAQMAATTHANRPAALLWGADFIVAYTVGVRC